MGGVGVSGMGGILRRRLTDRPKGETKKSVIVMGMGEDGRERDQATREREKVWG